MPRLRQQRLTNTASLTAVRPRPRRARTAFLLAAALACAAGAAHAEPAARGGITEWSSGVPRIRVPDRPVADVALPTWAEQAAERDTAARAWPDRSWSLLAEVACEYLDDGGCVITTRRVVRAGRTGAELPVVANYRPGTSRVEDATVWAAVRGQVFRYGREFLTDRPWSRDSVHVDGRVVMGSLSLAPGAVGATETVVRTRRPFDDFWLTEDDVAATYTRLRLAPPAGREPEWRSGPEPLPPPAREGDEWVWEVPARFVTDVPPGSERQGWWLQVRVPTDSLPATWAEVGRRLGAAFGAPAAERAEVRRLADSLSAGAADGAARRRRLAAAAQALEYTEIRIEIDTGGGLRPRTPVTVWRDGRGDCKDKVNLLCALLAAAGEQAWPALVEAGSPGDAAPPLPGAACFDHAIVAVRVPEGEAHALDPALGPLAWFDPTTPEPAWGRVHGRLAGKPCLLLAGDRSALGRVPLAAASPAVVERRFDATLDSAGTLVADLRVTYAGEAALFVKSTPHGLDERGRLAASALVAAWDETAALVDAWAAPDSAGARVRGFRYTITPAREGREELAVMVAPWPGDEWNDAHPDTLFTPVRTTGATHDSHAVLHLPPGAFAESLPEPFTLTTEAGEVSCEVRAGGDSLAWRVRYHVKPGLALTAGRTPELAKLAAALGRANTSRFVIALPWHAPAPPAGPPSPPPAPKPRRARPGARP